MLGCGEGRRLSEPLGLCCFAETLAAGRHRASGLFETPQYRRKPPISEGANLLEVVLVGPLYRVNQPVALLRFQARPRREVGPSVLKHMEQVLEEAVDAFLPGGEVVREMGSRGRPTQGRAQ